MMPPPAAPEAFSALGAIAPPRPGRIGPRSRARPDAHGWRYSSEDGRAAKEATEPIARARSPSVPPAPRAPPATPSATGESTAATVGLTGAASRAPRSHAPALTKRASAEQNLDAVRARAAVPSIATIVPAPWVLRRQATVPASRALALWDAQPMQKDLRDPSKVPSVASPVSLWRGRSLCHTRGCGIG